MATSFLKGRFLMSNSSTKKDSGFVRFLKYLFPCKGDKPGEIIRKIVFIIAASALVITLTMLISNKLQMAKTTEMDNSRANDFHAYETNNKVTIDTALLNNSGDSSGSGNENVEIQEKFLGLLQQNPETIGWITIQGKNDQSPFIDYVVMQCDDNDKYLYHDFNENYSRSGTIFVDYQDKITPNSQPANIVVYGHNMLTTEYFSLLPKYFNWGLSNPDHSDISFYKEHPTIEFSTLYKTSTYKIFGVMMLNTEAVAGEVFDYYLVHNFSSQSDFNEFVAEILDRSAFYNPDVDVRYGDQLLTLSTCMFGYGDVDLRFVVFARETREGESPEVDVEKAYYNPNPKFYQMYYDQFGYVWEGRKWDKKLLVGYED